MVFLPHRWITRSFSTLCTTAPIYVSRSTNPYFNLTFEDWLFRHKPPNEPLLFVYRDEPCVVIGRNQNPWTEANISKMRRTHTPLIRRRSGGGTVYHDLGNTNFSIHFPRASFDRNVTTQIVVRAVRSLGVNAHANGRDDIYVGIGKVSGSAYKLANQRAYHHGTMLISTRLGSLSDMLRSNQENMVTRGVASVRSPVCNLQQFNSSIDHDVFADAVIQEFRKEYNIDHMVHAVEEDEQARRLEYVRQGMVDLRSWEWCYGQTPEFTYTISKSFFWGDVTTEIRSKRGIILSCSFTHNQSDASLDDELNSLAKALEGKRYGFIEDATYRGLVVENRGHDVWDFLMQVMDS